MADVRILHNPNCSTSRHAVETAERLGVDLDIELYLKTKPGRDELLELIAQLEDDPADLVRKDSYFTDQGFDAGDYTTPEAVADLIAAHPRLLQRPVIVRDGKAIIGRPKDRVEPFLS
ncbi:MAG TPA: ArsC/Spx/MgsR family protein [Microthrixaceae bacterium]|nr:ArsC/Spx/MgsR family protein [Microthrixaceae bacterium]